MKTCLFFLLFFSATAIAQDDEKHPIDQQVDALFEKAKSRADEQGAYTKGLVLWDKEMNRIYDGLMKGLSKEAATRLKKSQRTWLTLRDHHVAYLDEFFEGLEGTMHLTSHSYAVMDVTRQRALALTRQLEYVEEGDYKNH
jgi:uncharacterized protein YecT (DUF1311 family)